MKLGLIWAAAASLVVTGCATGSDGIATAYSSPLKYQGYDCQQLAIEDSELASRVSQLKGVIDHRATNDKIAVGVGVVVFWPALFFIKGDGAEAADYARMKGDHEAITHAAMMKGCMAGSPGYSPAAWRPREAPLPTPAAGPSALPAPGPVSPGGQFSADGYWTSASATQNQQQ
jgi:hypothetical protein